METSLLQVVLGGGGTVGVLAWYVWRNELRIKKLENTLESERKEFQTLRSSFYNLKGITIKLVTLIKAKKGLGIIENGEFDKAIEEWERWQR